MKKLIIYSSIFFVFACGSEQKKSDDTYADTSEAESTEPVPVVTPEPSKVANKPATPPPKLNTNADASPTAISNAESDLDRALKSGQDAQIRRAATDLLLKNPQDVRALNSLAMSYYRSAEFTAALYLLTKANKINERSPEVLNNMGVVLMAQGEQHDAIQAFKKALSINSNNSFAAANLGQIYIKNKDYTKAVAAYETATSNGIRDWKTMTNFAIAQTAVHNYDKADGIYKDLMKSQSSQREIVFNYAVLLIDKMGKYDQGLELVRKLQFVGPPADTRKKVSELEAKAKAGSGK